MDAKTYLRNPKRILGGIVRLQERIENLRKTMLPKGVRYDRDKVQTSLEDPMIIFAVKIDQLERELLDKQIEYDKALEEIDSTIARVNNDDARTVLTKRYIGMKRWKVIEAEEFISESQVYRFHRIGVREVEKILNDMEVNT